MVAYESEDKRGQVNKKETWYERKKETIDTISRLTDEGAKMVCLADKVSNLRSFHLGLFDQGEKFWENFNQSDPKMHYWYYDSLRKALSSLSDEAVYKEYCFLIDTIFKKYMQEQIE